jgi:hypothetical protein
VVIECLVDLLHLPGEHLSDLGHLLADHVGVHAECYRRIGVTEPLSHHVHRDARQ